MALRYANNKNQKISYREQIEDQKFGYNLSSHLENLNNEYNNLYSSYASRFFDKDGNFVEGYNRDDSDAEYKKYLQYQSKLVSDISKVEGYLSKYADAYDSNTRDKLTSFLTTAKDNLSKMGSAYEFYSNFHTEYDYNAYLMNNTNGVDSNSINIRQNAYAANSSRIAELDNAIKNFKFENDASWDWETMAKNQAEYDALVAEKKKLEAENRKYKHGNKTNDDNFSKYQNAEDFDAVSENRDYNHPSVEGIRLIKSAEDSRKHSTFPGDYVSYEYNPDDYIIEDPLGTYLNSTQEDRLWVLSNMDTNNATVREYVKTISDGDLGGWEYLNEDEIKLYYYMWNSDLKEEAISYLKGMETELDRRANVEQIEGLENASSLELILHNAASVPANILGGGIAFIEDTLARLQGEEINPYSGGHAIQNYAQNVRSATANDLNEWTANAEFLKTSLGDVYQSVMSGIDSIAGAVTMGSGYTVLMGMGAASSKAKELYEKGASNTEIAMGGLLSGAAEMVFEKISIERFLKNFINSPVTLKNIIPKILAQGGVELSEEMATEIANTISDAVVMGSQSDWKQAINKYKDLGYSDSESITKAFGEICGNVVEAGIGGFISGAFMGGGGSIINLAQNKSAESDENKKTGTNIITNENLQNLVAAAENLPNTSANAKIKAVANEIKNIDVSKLSEKERAALSKKVGKLYSSIQSVHGSMIQTSGRDTLTNIISEKLKENGVTDEADIKKATDAIIKTVYGEKQLSASESKLLDKVGGNKIASYLLNNEKEILAKVNVAHSQRWGQALETESLTKDKNANVRTIDTDNYTFSDNGETYIKGTDEAVTVTGINSIKDGKMKVNLSNGKTADLSELDLGSEDQAIIYEGVLGMGIDAASAQAIVKGFDFNGNTGISAKSYILGMQDAVKYGKIGGKAFIDSGVFTSMLSESHRKMGYRIGEMTAENAAKKDAQRVNASIKLNKKGNITVGKVSFDGISEKDLDIKQKTTVKILEQLFGGRGVNIVFFRSKVVNGKHVGENGSFDAATNTIRLDINAGIQGNDTILFTAAHELTHFIRLWSHEKFKVFADFLVESYAKHGIDIDVLVEQQIKKAKSNGREIDYDTAYEEVVADSCETFLRDSNLLDRLIDLAKKDMTLFEKTQLYIATLLDDIRKCYNDYEPDTPEARAVLKWKDSIEKLHSLWEEAALSALDNSQKAGGKIQKNTTSDGDVMFMARSDVLSWDINWDSDNFSDIKSQLIKHQEEVNKMDVVTKVKYTHSNKKALSEQVDELLKNNFGYKIETQNYGTILFDPKAIDNAMDYINNPAEAAALLAAPYVLKRGKAISGHKNHKNKGNPSVTFAAPAELNGEIGNVAVAVLYGAKHRIHALRVLTPSGKVFELSKTKDTESTSAGSTTKSSVRSAINSVSTDIIPQTSKKSQEKQSGRDNTIGERNLEDFADAKDTEGKTLFQYRAMESDEDVYREMLKTANIMNDTEIDSLFDTIDRAMDIIKDNLEILDYAWDADIDDRAFNPVKKNTDKLYQVSVDFSTLCRKRLLQQTIQAHLQDALDRPLTKNEGIAIRDALMTIQEEGKKIEIACALCYVESARMKSPSQIKRFVDDRESVIKNHFAGKSNDVKAQLKEAEAKARKRLGVDDTPLTKLPSKTQKEIRAAKKDVISSYVPSANEQELIEIAKGMSVNDFVTPKGLENLIKKYPDLFEAYASYIVNATHSKGIENDTWWRAGDSKNIGDTLIANMNAENGLRSQSWSDFQVIHLLDYIAATIELSTRKAKMQAYTKVPDFVELMGNTGEMINLSLIPTRNFNGTLEFDSVEGMAFEESLRLRDKYHATTGTIAIGIGNAQIQMLLESMDIDYVIPYHRSGMSKAVRKAMHIPTWDEYENHQSEKNLSRDDAKRQAKKYGVKLLSESDSNYQKHPNFSDWFDIKEARQIAKMENSNPSDKAMAKKYGVMYGGYMAMQNAANNYLKLCAERGISPKFSHKDADFTVEDNYWKLLIDRKMVDNVTGEVIEQQAVKPIFDQNEILRILNDELERYPTVKADQDYATRKVAEHFLSGNIKGGMSAEAIAKAMKKPVDNVAKVNILASVEDSKLSDRVTAEEDAEYMDAYFDGDDDLMQELVDKVANRLGYKYKAYHHTENVFTVFDLSKARANMDIQGFFFSADKDAESEYGSVRYDTYLKMDNPYIVDSAEKQKAIPFDMSKDNAGVIAREWLQNNGYDGVIRKAEYYGAEADEYIVFDSSQIKSSEPMTFADDEYGEGDVIPLSERFNAENEDIRYSERVTDEETLDYLNEQIEKGEYIKVYRSFQVIDGGLYAPMNAVDRDENGKNKRLGYRSEYGVWEKSTESPEIAQRYMDSHPEAPYAKFDLDGVDNKTNAVAYNPYLHASNLVLNDQFAAAYRRKLITVECYVPLSEANGTYKAQYAKDATGWVDWKAGGVAGKLLKAKPEYTRKLFVSRYMLPVRQVPDSEVAAMYKEYLDGTDIAVPWNVVTPNLRNELEKVGVNISYEDVKAGGKTISFNDVFSNEVKYSERDKKAADDIAKVNKQLAAENVKLIEDVKNLKELVKLQGKETHGKMLKKSTVELVAKRLTAYSNAKGDVAELVGYLTDVYSHIIQGEDVSWESIKEKSQAAVDWLMQNEYHKPVRDEYANEILKHLRTARISLSESQKNEVAYKYGSYNDFRKKNMGRVIFTDNGLPLDSSWQELAEMYPMYFDKDVNSGDQPIMLTEIIDGLQNTYAEDEYHYYSDEMVAQDLLTKVYEGYWDVSALHTVADAKQKEINLLKAKHIERMDELKKTHAENEAKLRKEHKEKVSELRTQYREREEKKIRKVAEYYQKSRKEAVDRVRETREKRDAVTKLQKIVLDTAKWVSYPKKDDVKCPDIIRGPYAEFLSSIDLSSKRLSNGGEPTLNDLRVSSAMDSLAKAIEKKLGTQSPDTDTETVLDTGYLDLPVHFVENLKELAEDLKNRMAIDGHIVNSMTSEEVKALTKFIRTLNHSIKEMSTLYANMRFARVEQLGNDSMVFLKYLGEAKQSNSVASFVTWDNALPYYTFKRFGTGGESVFEELMDAQDKLAYLADEIFKFKEKTWTDKEASEWSKDTHTIKLPSGRELTLTTSDAMSIYCLSRREQGRQHLLGGGVRVLGIEKNGKKANDSRSLLNEQDLLAIASSLTERQRKVAETIQEYMSTVCSEWGNEISMKRFLTKEFTEKFYFPIESNDENLDTKDPKAQQSDLYRLLNISATKPLTKGANNEVIIRNVFDVFTSHSSDMARLNAYGMALLDYMKWINYREKTVNDDGQISVSGVRKSMEKAYGPEAKKYVIGLIKDINGRANDGGDHPILMKMMRGAKTAMVGANLRVSLLQFTAYPRAAMVLSSNSLALGLTKMPQIEKAKKYCGIALWKSFGFYDTNISRSIEDQIKGTTNIRQKLIELSLKGAEWGDAITWGCLWNACEYEVAKTKQYKVGSEEFNQAVGKKLREVVYATQVVDSTLTRSQMMKSKSGLTQSASAFMSEPTLSANILMDAGFQFNLEKRRTGSAKLALEKTGKHIGKAVAVYSVGQIIAALAEALADAYRDDDDEEFIAKFGKAFKENAISDLNPFNKIPIIADVSDLIMSCFGIGFSSSNSLYLQAISEGKNAFDIWSKVIKGEDGETVYAGIYSTTKLLSYITGVSASGLMREVVTLWNNTAGVVDPYLKVRTYESSATDKGIAEYKFDKGDTASVKKTVSKMIEDKVKWGKTEKEAKSAIRSSFTSTYKPEYMAAVKAKDYDEMNRIRKFLYATGLYGTLSELDETLKKWRTAE